MLGGIFSQDRGRQKHPNAIGFVLGCVGGCFFFTRKRAATSGTISKNTKFDEPTSGTISKNTKFDEAMMVVKMRRMRMMRMVQKKGS